MLIAQQDFRDEEYFIPKSIFQQQGLQVQTAAPEIDQAVGAFGGVVAPDITFDDIKVDGFDAVVFVGGAGAMKDLDNKAGYSIAREAASHGKVLGAICIAPAILANAGVLKGKKATVWSSNMDKSAVKILKAKGVDFQKERVVVDGNIITADGFESARRFAETIVGLLKG